SIKNITILLIIAFFLLLISWLNYNNLVTAQCIERAKEISIKKILGANGLNIGSQSIIETFVLNLIPVLFATMILMFFLPRFNKHFGQDIALVQNYIFWLISVITIILGTLFSGIYPAYRLASFKPKDIINGKFSHTKKGLYLRNIFLSFQLIISLSLMIIANVVSKQMSYMKSYEKGFRGRNVVVIEHPESANDIVHSSYVSFKNELLKFPQIKNVTVTTDYPGKLFKFRETVVKDNTHSIESDLVFSDEDYFDIFDLNVLYGRKFSKTFISDKDQILINETAAAALGYDNYKDAIHQKVKIRGIWREILGIVKNYNHLSLKNKIEPIVYINQGNCYHYYAVELKSGSLKEGIDIIKNKYNEIFSGSKIKFNLLEDIYNEQYKQDDYFASLLNILSVILITITCFGLWGLALFDSSLRKKEICIRRIFGSEIKGVMLLQLKNYFIIFGISFLITIAPVYIICTNWLKDFPYRTSIGYDTFVYSGLILFAIINLTVIYQTLKASYSNPTMILKTNN
ncbi:MAG TPA: FtsX-like permease family protein, partial [Bacteroidales bacterium]